ncbi:ATP-dependent DNA helicase UvrD/PcrA [Enhygromyxa salina]|uniref:DNA 3'-5' helicase n=1 Tax=Enhygromyxa salina TaxID=215803 RepID=A0A0C2CV82_9BACT|nr:UvrD-helicase domain-containing protein [Enhygromyxa salina]KIG13495.1 ATP-dependent DNA helicase UvrD/PcrA [Enhygromyxa salina]
MSSSQSLNPAQRAGVEYRGGPLLLLAGAGTGKTRVITHRVAALIDEGVPAWRILAVTFTNKAAHEMRERIAGLLGLGLDELRRDGPWIGTFHSICARILRRHGEGVGLSRNFAIYDADDQKSLMRKVLKALDIDPRMFSASAALGKIDAAKNLGWGRERLGDLGYGEPVLSWTRRAWAMYEDQLRSSDAADFGDLLTLTVQLLRNAGAPPSYPPAQANAASTPSRTVKLHTEREPAAAASAKVDPVVGLRRRFFHVVVDEYQDTNPVQAELVDLLCGERAQLCVVGDDDQAIYGWRGADVEQILRFPDRHPGCEIIRLEQNYRSTSLILDCANAVIRDGPRRHDKQLWSELGAGEHVDLYGFDDEREEARFVARTIQVAIDDGESPSEIAVFYRTHAQSRPLEEAMRLYGIRYRMLGGIRFYDRREIKDLVGYLRLLTNPASDLDCLRVINVPPRRIGSKTIERLSSWAVRNEKSFYEATGPASKYGEDAGLGKAARRAVKEFHDVVAQLAIDAQNLAHDQIAALVLERTGYTESLEQEPDGETRIENLEEFVGSLEQFVTEQPEASLAEYLEQISLATSGDDESADTAITLMTIHSAKGLEFDRVMLTGMEDGVFPHMRALREGDPSALEEERRLAYVALTRARRRLAISYVRSRFLWGESKLNMPSEFLRSLPDAAVARHGLATSRRRRPAARIAPQKREPQWDDEIELEPEYAGSGAIGRKQPVAATAETVEYDSVEYDPVEWFKGMQVRHPKFGVGTVLSWSGAGEQLKLTLVFGAARKTIMARFCTPL